jgi:hypothetical protein
MKKGSDKTSPIKAKPLRNPGESAHQESRRIVEDFVFSYFLYAGVVVCFALVEWLRYFLEAPYYPWAYTVVAAIFASVAALKIYRVYPEYKNYQQGAEGEKVVGQCLQELIASGGKVFHDIPGEGFNIDHVVIHPAGIFAVETKTYSKPAKRKSELDFDGANITMFGKPLISDPVVQSTAAAKWLSSLLEESTGKSWAIKPVVLFPGWFVKSSVPLNSSPVWVFTPKGFVNYIGKCPEKLQPDQIAMAAFHLSRYIRTS